MFTKCLILKVFIFQKSKSCTLHLLPNYCNLRVLKIYCCLGFVWRYWSNDHEIVKDDEITKLRTQLEEAWFQSAHAESESFDEVRRLKEELQNTQQ